MSLSMKRRLALPAAKMAKEPKMPMPDNKLPPNTRHRNGMRGKMK